MKPSLLQYIDEMIAQMPNAPDNESSEMLGNHFPAID
jgi:hypothetical protein